MIEKIKNFIFKLSPKMLAQYLVFGSSLWVFVFIITSIALKLLGKTFSIGSTIALLVLFSVIASLAVLYLLWLLSTVHSVNNKQLGLPLKWFHISFILFIAYLAYMLGYPLLCHYSARAIIVKKTNKPATFLRAIPITLLLSFGVILAIPFLHKYFSAEVSKNSDIIKVYAIALGIIFITLIVGFLA